MITNQNCKKFLYNQHQEINMMKINYCLKIQKTYKMTLNNMKNEMKAMTMKRMILIVNFQMSNNMTINIIIMITTK